MTSGATIQLLGIVLIFVVLYMLMIRPQRKKEKAVNEMRNALKVGDEITTIGGFKGKIVNVKDETLIIKVGGDGVKMEVTRWAISRVDSAVGGTTKADNTKPADKKDEKAEDAKPEVKKPKKLGAAAAPSTDEPSDEADTTDEVLEDTDAELDLEDYSEIEQEIEEVDDTDSES